MPETLTESFCERCGTRYEFKAPTRLNPLRKTRGLIGGLKNYLTSQDDLTDAIGDAMRTEEDALADAQLEAFHESFNFCIECRQYTCLNCWNDDAGRCRTCAPVAGTDDLAERLAAATASASPAMDAVADQSALDALEAPDLQRRLGLDAWPTSDLPAPAATQRADIPWPGVDVAASPFDSADRTPSPTEFERPLAEAEPEPVAEPMVAEVEAEPEPVAEPMVAEVEAEPEPVAEPMVAEVDAEPMVAWEPVALDDEAVAEPAAEAEPEAEEAAPRLLRVVAWDEDSELLVAEAEPEPVMAEAEPEPVMAEAEPEPFVAEAEPEPEPVAAEVEPEPEPVARAFPPTPRIAPISETILRFPSERTVAPVQPAEPEQAPVAAEDESPDVAARRAQLDLLGLGDPGEGPVVPQRPAVLPYRSRGAAAAQGVGFWEASAREVASAPANIGVQSCGECGLSLSANARFCRRCGTRQARSA